MTEPITLEQLQNASRDADTLAEVINGDENTDVTSRFGATYPTLDKALKTIIAKGGLNAVGFATYADMTLSQLDDGSHAIVTNDTDTRKIGVYVKSHDTWVKTRYHDHQDIMRKSSLIHRDTSSDNIAQTANDTYGFYIYTGKSDPRYAQVLAQNTGAVRVISVEPDETYSIYASSFQTGRFFAGWSDTADVFNTKQTTPATLLHTQDPNIKKLVVPSNTNYLFVMTRIGSLNFDIRDSLWINKGEQLSINAKKQAVAIGDSYFYDELAHSRIDNLPINESPLKNKKWVVIGDSITAKTFRANKNYHDFVSEAVGGMTVYNYGISGSGYNDRHAVASTITQRDVDLITVALGVNDYGKQTVNNPILLGNFLDTGISTISGCINTLITSLMTKYPTHTKIAILTPLPTKYYYGYKPKPNSSYSYGFVELVDMIKKYAEHYSLPCLDLYRQSNLQPWITDADNLYFTPHNNAAADGLHPNEAGHERISKKIKSFLESI